MFIIPEIARPFLVAQKGSLDYLRKDQAQWDREYERVTWELFDNIKLHVRIGNVLDIGSGLSGIGIYIAKMLNSDVYLLDGEADEPKVKLHRQTFNDMAVAKVFWEANGVDLAGYFTPALLYKGAGPRPEFFDTVVSFGAWCFHVEPKVYLDWAFLMTRAGSRLIVDLRKGRDWNEHIVNNGFKLIASIRDKEKFSRNVYERN